MPPITEDDDEFPDDDADLDHFEPLYGLSFGSPRGLRRVATARTIEAMNKGVENGFFPLVMPVIKNPKISNCVRLHQDQKTGFVEQQGDLRRQLASPPVTDFIPYYPYNILNPYAAYLMPRDIQIGELVWLEDVIEDIVAMRGSQFFCGRLGACAAKWNGTTFEVQFDEQKNVRRYIG